MWTGLKCPEMWTSLKSHEISGENLQMTAADVKTLGHEALRYRLNVVLDLGSRILRNNVTLSIDQTS